MTKINFLFLLALFFVNLSLYCSVRLSTSSKQHAANTIYITADNVVDSITINGSDLSLTGISGLGDWTQTSTVVVPFDIKEGDKIEISATNSGAWSESNPASIIATIFYKNNNGDIVKLNTNSFWTCDDAAPLVIGNNGVGPWGPRPNIDSSAQHLWNSDSTKPSTRCSTSVPVSTNGTIFITVDNVITDITVGNEKVDLANAAGINDWTLTKAYDVNIKDGDIISFSGLNSGDYSTSNPGSIIATIIYSNSKGEKVTLNTGEDWTCDGSAPKVYGTNGIGPWGVRPNIDPLASHIWNTDETIAKTTCSFITNLPKNAKLFITVDNIITDITIAGVKIDLTKASGVDDWTQTKAYDVDFNDGDEVSITGLNSGAYSTSNPGSILATIKFSSNGENKEINTNGDWICNNNPAALLGNNGVSPWGERPSISDSASHIWSSDLTEATVTCTFNKKQVVVVVPTAIDNDCDE